LTAEEAETLRAHPPAGVILFARNIRDPAQLAGLVAALRRVLVPDAVLMVDQEGGRVARLRPPHWRAHPPVAALGGLFGADMGRGLRASFLSGALIGMEAAAAGFDVVAAPVLDRLVPGADAIVGDRAFGADPRAIARLGRAFAEGLLAAGVQPVIKHLPGHGRARADSHRALPVVNGPDEEADADILPFALNAGLPWAMTAHILYPTWDAALPATLSRAVVEGVIRGRIGFSGVLVSDDLAMGALSGAPADRALAALAAAIWYVRPQEGAWPLALIGVAWLLRLVVYGTLTRSTPFDIPLLVFLASALVAAAIGYNQQRDVLDSTLPFAWSWAKYWAIVAGIALFYAVANLRRVDQLWWFARAYALLAVAVTLYFLATNDWQARAGKFDWLTQLGVLLSGPLPEVAARRLHPNAIGGAIALLLPFCVALLLEARARRAESIQAASTCRMNSGACPYPISLTTGPAPST